MKNPNDPIKNRTCDLPAYSAVPQPTAPPHTPAVLKVLFSRGLITEGKRPLGRLEHGWEIKIKMKITVS
jgi:hypothetical protein